MTSGEDAELTREATRKAARVARSRRTQRDLWSSLVRAAGLGWVLAVPLALGAAGGRLVAGWLGRPWIALAGVALGLVAGAYGLYREVKASLANDEERRNS